MDQLGHRLSVPFLNSKGKRDCPLGECTVSNVRMVMKEHAPASSQAAPLCLSLEFNLPETTAACAFPSSSSEPEEAPSSTRLSDPEPCPNIESDCEGSRDISPLQPSGQEEVRDGAHQKRGARLSPGMCLRLLTVRVRRPRINLVLVVGPRVHAPGPQIRVFEVLNIIY